MESRQMAGTVLGMRRKTASILDAVQDLSDLSRPRAIGPNHLEHFRAKWVLAFAGHSRLRPVRVKKARQNKNLEPGLIPSKPEWL
jgi:hypothetical protein